MNFFPLFKEKKKSEFVPLVPTHSTILHLDYDFSTMIGNPYGNHATRMGVKNSRKEIVKFINNGRIVQEALTKFNEEVLQGECNLNPIKLGNVDTSFDDITLRFTSLFLKDGEIHVKFNQYLGLQKVVPKETYIQAIKNNCQFFLEGEIFLDETETEMIEMNVTSLSYMNIEALFIPVKLFSIS